MVLVLAVFCLAFGGCRGAGGLPKATAPEGARPGVSRQLIIKFRHGTVSCDPAGVARFSAMSKVSLQFVRSMSGGACVVTQFADSESGLLLGEKTLELNPAVEYAEPDAVMKAF